MKVILLASLMIFTTYANALSATKNIYDSGNPLCINQANKINKDMREFLTLAKSAHQVFKIYDPKPAQDIYANALIPLKRLLEGVKAIEQEDCIPGEKDNLNKISEEIITLIYDISDFVEYGEFMSEHFLHNTICCLLW